jgi:hypothetical protein
LDGSRPGCGIAGTDEATGMVSKFIPQIECSIIELATLTKTVFDPEIPINGPTLVILSRVQGWFIDHGQVVDTGLWLAHVEHDDQGQKAAGSAGPQPK